MDPVVFKVWPSGLAWAASFEGFSPGFPFCTALDSYRKPSKWNETQFSSSALLTNKQLEGSGFEDVHPGKQSSYSNWHHLNQLKPNKLLYPTGNRHASLILQRGSIFHPKFAKLKVESPCKEPGFYWLVLPPEMPGSWISLREGKGWWGDHFHKYTYFLLWTGTPVFSTNSTASVTQALGKAVVRNSRCRIYTAESIPSLQFTNSAENDPSGAGLFYELWPQVAHWKCSYYQIVLCKFPFKMMNTFRVSYTWISRICITNILQNSLHFVILPYHLRFLNGKIEAQSLALTCCKMTQNKSDRRLLQMTSKKELP